MATTDTQVASPIINILTKSQYQGIAAPSATEFYLITDDSPITAGSGLTAVVAGGETMISHTNSITAVTTQALYPITVDAQGHITSVGTATTGGASYTVTVTGTGNAITNIGLSGTTITATKGSSFASSTHTHGEITNAGAITTTVTIATGDKLVITDSSDSSKLKASGISFGTTTSSFLSNDGTWKQPAKYGTSLPSSGDFVGQIFVLTE